MYCPSCEHRLEAGVEKCDLCGFHFAKLDRLYGREDVAMDQITDATHRLRGPDKEALWEVIDTFHERFPQFFTAIYLGELSQEARLSEFAAWLLNRARVDVEGDYKDGTNAFLIIVDLKSRAATISAGYYAEQFVSETDLRWVLESAAPTFAANQITAGLQLVLNHLQAVLRRNYRVLTQPSRRARRADSPPPLIS